MLVRLPNAYQEFAYTVSFGAKLLGGFSDMSGLGRAAGLPKTAGVTLKRGVVNANELYGWLNSVRGGANAARQVTITVFDRWRHPVAVFTLRNARPIKWTGPALTAKGGSDLSMEEIVLSYEAIDPPE